MSTKNETLTKKNSVPLVTNIALYMVDSSNVEDFWTFE